MRRPLLILFCANLALVLFPVLASGTDPTGTDALFYDQITLYGRVLSSVVTPLLVIGTLWLTIVHGRKAHIPAQFLFPALLVCVSMCVSAAVADTIRGETLIMGLFFVIFTLYLAQMRADPRGSDEVLHIFKAYFVIWLLAPLLAMLADPELASMFFVITSVDVSYHGLADSRVGFGLWVPVYMILIGKPKTKGEWFLMVVAAATLLLSQSRGAVVGLLLSAMYALTRSQQNASAQLRRLLGLVLLCGIPLVLWSVFGRDDALAVSEDRDLILSRFIAYVGQHWLFGHGSMYLIDLPEFAKIDVPAHNLVLQTIANYGVPALLALLFYLASVFATLRSTRARMLVIFLFIYSMSQPVQGTGNFFNPITLLFFLIVFAVDNVEGAARRATLLPTTRLPPPRFAAKSGSA